MHLLKIVFASLLLGTLQQYSLGLKQGCPPESAVQPCICEKQTPGSSLILRCEGIHDQTGEQLRRAVTAVSEYQVQQMLLRSSTLGTVPDNLLQGSNIVGVSIQDVTFNTLDPFAMVSGNKDMFFGLLVTNVFANNWQFSTRANDFRNLNFLAFTYYEKNATSPTPPDDFLTFLPETMVGIVFQNLAIGRVEEPGFSQFPNISEISLLGNRLHEINRKVFPKPATNLHHLDLSNNSLASLPEDIFKDMPSLNMLNLDFNQFTHFDQNTFTPIWDRLGYVSLQGNPLHCGCDAAWLIQKKSSRITALPTCASPPQFKGRALESLSVSDLCPAKHSYML